MSLNNLRELLKLPSPIYYNYSEIDTVEIGPHIYRKVGILNLKTMCLSQMDLGDEGAVALADSFLILPCMETLFFYENGVGEKGAYAFVLNLRKARALKYLSLSGNYIPPECVERIYSMNNNRAVNINLSWQRKRALPMIQFEQPSYRTVSYIEKPRGNQVKQLLRSEAIDLRDESMLIPDVQAFGQGLPDYCTVDQGLNFCSRCINPGCIAYNNTIYVAKGLGKFNIAEVSASLNCPKCKNKAAPPTNFGFHLAQWVFADFTRGGKTVKIPSGRTSTREYYTWKEGDRTIWRFLKMQVDAYSP